MYVSTSNLGKVFLLGGSPAVRRQLRERCVRRQDFLALGSRRISRRGNVELFARSGNVDNPDRNWSSWKPVDLQKDAELTSRSARFVQWKAVLHAGDPAPRVDSVLLNYLPKNVAPDFDDVSVQVGTALPAVAQAAWSCRRQAAAVRSLASMPRLPALATAIPSA